MNNPVYQISVRRQVERPDDVLHRTRSHFGRAGNPSAGLKLIRTGIDTVRSQGKSELADRDASVLLGSAYVYEGEALENVGDKREALQSYKKAAAKFESPAIAVERAFNPLTAASYGKVAGALAKLGYRDQARETYNKALALLDLQPGSGPATLHVQYALLEIYAGLARLESQSVLQGATPASAENNACKWYKKVGISGCSYQSEVPSLRVVSR